MYTVQTLAKRLGVTDRCVYNWINNGNLRYTEEKGKGIFISEDSLDSFLEQNPKYDFNFTGTNGYTIKQFAKTFGFNHKTVQTWIETGKLKTVKTTVGGRMHVITKEEAERFIAERNGQIEKPKPTTSESPEKLYTVREAAKLFDISDKTLYYAIEHGTLKTNSIGGKIRLSKDDIYDYINNHSHNKKKTNETIPVPISASKKKIKKNSTLKQNLSELITACEMVTECLKNVRDNLEEV